MGASIYIADDEKNIRDLITKFLESDGYSVTAFETGDELMEEFLKKPCELVILDIMMRNRRLDNMPSAQNDNGCSYNYADRKRFRI